MSNHTHAPQPILRVELEGIRQQIAVMFDTHASNAVSALVEDTLAKKLNEEWVQTEINAAVTACLRGAIRDIANSHTLKRALTDMLAEQLRKQMEPEDE